jgi:transcription initiation factor IIE alpha subunit
MDNSIDRNFVPLSANAQRTSRLSAESVLPKTGTMRRSVYEYFMRRGMNGATDQEVSSALHIDGNTIRPLRGTLVQDGWIVDSGATRKNEKGHDCIVWRIVEQGMML